MRRPFSIAVGLLLAALLRANLFKGAHTLENSQLEMGGAAESLKQDFNPKLESNTRDSYRASEPEVPRLFNLDRFKAAFGRSYATALEEVVRMKLYLARSYEVFISAVAYRYRLASYHKAINEFSDQTTDELETMRNKYPFGRIDNQKAADADAETASGGSATHLNQGAEQKQEQEVLIEPEELSAELAKIREHSREAGFVKLAAELERLEERGNSDFPNRKRRTRRSVPGSSTAGALPRQGFNIEEAFLLPNEKKADVKADEKRTHHDSNKRAPVPKSNNPNYQPPELMTRGAATRVITRDYTNEPGYKQIHLKRARGGQLRSYEELPVKSNYRRNGILTKLTSAFISKDQQERKAANEEASDLASAAEPDVVWVDHRQSGCMTPAGRQGPCGSCYVFAPIAYFEWLHCRETGQLVKFSEQYVIDCGRVLDDFLFGCSGGDTRGVARFVANFGLELERHYPHLAYENTCPYRANIEMDQMGYLRTQEVSRMVQVDLGYADKYLSLAPMLVNIYVDNDFLAYGGGVFDGRNCASRVDHTVLIVGHGRQDGEEYWLIRNSHGPNWGEQGHLKLNKNSKCVFDNVGIVFGTRTGDDPRLGAQRNANIGEPVKAAGYNPAKAVWQIAKNIKADG